MIPVAPKPEYAGFDADVRQPGAAFLAANPNPKSRDFRNFWSRALAELHTAYGGVCAYTCVYLMGSGTVDHYISRSANPRLAYEWANFRLSSAKANNNKGSSTEVIDPFQVGAGWFELDLPSCQLKPARDLAAPTRRQVSQTINILRLNQDDTYVQERMLILLELAAGNITMEFMRRRYPFLALEVTRLGVENRLNEVLRFPRRP